MPEIFVDEMTLNASTRHVFRFLKQGNSILPIPLQEKFVALSYEIARMSDGPEVTVALRKLLECRDSVIRALS